MSAARGVVLGVVGRGASFVLAYLATILLARHLGPAEYGVYGVVLSVLLWIEQTGRFTIPPASAKLIPEDRDRSASVQEAALATGAALFAVLCAALLAAAGPLAALFELDERGALLFRIAALDLPLFGLYVVYRGVLQGHRDFVALSVADVLYTAGRLAGVLLLLAVAVSVSGALLTHVAASVCGLLFVMRRVTIRPRRPSADPVRALIVLAFPLGLYMLALQTITNLDLWSLTVLDPAGEADTIGLYVAARNLAVVPGVVLMVVSDILLPSLSRALASGDARLPRMYIQGAVRFLAILLVPVVFVLMLGADDLMRILYSERFDSGGTFVRVLVLYGAALPFMDLFASALTAHGEPYRGGVTLLVMIPLATAAYVALVGAYGPLGAAYGSALSGLAGAMMLGALVVKRFGPLVAGRTFLNIAAAGALMAAAAWLGIAQTSALVVYAICPAVYALTLVALRELRPSDLQHLAFWRGGGR